MSRGVVKSTYERKQNMEMPEPTSVALVFEFDPHDPEDMGTPPFRFEWNRSRTVNVFMGTDEIDVFTYTVVPSESEVLEGCREWLAEDRAAVESWGMPTELAEGDRVADEVTAALGTVRVGEWFPWPTESAPCAACGTYVGTDANADTHYSAAEGDPYCPECCPVCIAEANR